MLEARRCWSPPSPCLVNWPCLFRSSQGEKRTSQWPHGSDRSGAALLKKSRRAGQRWSFKRSSERPPTEQPIAGPQSG